MSKKAEDLKPGAREAAKAAMAELIEKGVKFCITSTLRTLEEQQAYYAQGRMLLGEVNRLRAIAGFYLLGAEENKKVITNCDGIKFPSNHQGGTAIDIVPSDKGRPVWPSESDPRWLAIAQVMTAHGFRWGGDWNGNGKTRYDGDLSETMVDYPHYEWKGAT